MKKLVFLLALMQLAFLVEINGQLTNGLVSYWKLDGSAADATGTNNGTLNGTSSTTTGKIGTAYSFAPQPNFYISIPNSTSLNIQTNTITLSAWVKPTSGGTQMIISKISGVGTHIIPYFQYNLQLYQGSTLYPRFLLSIGGTVRSAASSSISLNYNQWHHITGTYDGTNMRLYVNGAQVATTAVTGNIMSYSTPVYISKNGVLGETFIGAIDEVGIWNRALTAAEVTSLYNNGSGLAYPFQTTSIPVTSVTITPNPATVPSGGTLQLTATILPENATNKTLDWIAMCDESKLTVNDDGLVTAIGAAGYTGTIGAFAHNGTQGTTSVTIANGTLPVISTTAASSITQNTATSGGNVTSAGSASVTARGVCWSTSANPTVTLSTKTSNGTGTGSFTSSITGLAANTTYHVRAYATSSVGTSYGSDVTFLTSPTTPTVTTTTPSSISQTTATCGGNVTSNGGATLTARGVCWSTSANPTVDLSTKTTDGTATGTFTSSITGLTAQTTYHVRAYATNSVGTSYGSDITFATLGAPGTWQSNGSNIYYSVTGGKVGIGTTTPATELTVNGKILAKEVEVVSSITSDYVFEPAYQLMPLTDLEIYLKQHKHLPGIPSALEFKDKGQNLGEMQDILLRKIEELTLYMIELKKENQELKARLVKIENNWDVIF